MLMSIRSAPAAATCSAAEAITSGSWPEQLHRHRVLVGMDPQQLAQRALVAVVDGEARDHLRDGQAGAVALGLQAHEPVADPGQRRQHDPVGDRDAAEASSCRCSERGMADFMVRIRPCPSTSPHWSRPGPRSSSIRSRASSCSTPTPTSGPERPGRDEADARGAARLACARPTPAARFVFPMHEPEGYPTANDMVLEAAAASDGLLVPFCRVNPHERRRGRGPALPSTPARAGSSSTRGPSSSRSTTRRSGSSSRSPTSARCPILIHAGRGIPALGLHAVELAGEFPDARLILAHAGICDLSAGSGASRPTTRTSSSTPPGGCRPTC